MKIQTKYIGIAGTATLILLIVWFVSSAHFSVEYEGDKNCFGTYENPCEWGYNITLVTIPVYYIQNKNLVQFNFTPEVKEFYNCKKDGRYSASWRADRSLAPCGIGWKEFDWKTPLTSKYKYINKFYKGKKQEFKIVVFKFNPEDVIKFGGEIAKSEFDPYFYGYNITKLCEWKTEQEDVFDYITYEYTCNTSYFNFTLEPKFATCYNINWNATNETNQTNIVFQHSFDYGYKPNKTIYWDEFKKVGTKDIQICDKVIGYKINDKIIDFYTCGIYCTRNETVISCDMCSEESGVVDANCDGILQSGESGFKFDVKNIGWHNLRIKADNPKFKKLKECAVK